MSLWRRQNDPVPDDGQADDGGATPTAWDAPTVDGLYDVLDWAGVATFRAGGKLGKIVLTA